MTTTQSKPTTDSGLPVESDGTWSGSSRSFLDLREEPWQRACLTGRISDETSGREELASRTATRTRDSDSSLARATMLVLAAYAELAAADPKGLPQNAIPSFGSVCVSLCSTVVAIDELTAAAWGQA